MSLKERIDEDLKSSLKAGEAPKTSVLRMLMAEVKNKEIELRGVRPLIDNDIVSLVRWMIKTHQESVTAFEKGGRRDLADQEKNELVILNSYVPSMMKEGQIQKVIQEMLANRHWDFGSAMKEVMARLKGQADGSLVSRLVKDHLSR